MKNSNIVFWFIAFVFGCQHATINSAFAERAERAPFVLPSFCEKATDTAQMLNCKNKELDYVQNHLKALYEELTATVSPEKAGRLLSIQNKWLSYRDAECAWEESWAEGQSVARLYELSCLVSLTQSIIERLLSYNDAENELVLPEQGIFPRWQNVLIEMGANYYWNFDASEGAGQICNASIMNVTPGILVEQQNPSAKEKGDDGSANANVYVLALTQSGVTGRPDIDIVRNVQKGDLLNASCHQGFQVERLLPKAKIKDHHEQADVGAPIVEGHVSEDIEDNKGKVVETDMDVSTACRLRVVFEDPQCTPITLEDVEGQFVIVSDGADKELTNNSALED